MAPNMHNKFLHLLLITNPCRNIERKRKSTYAKKKHVVLFGPIFTQKCRFFLESQCLWWTAIRVACHPHHHPWCPLGFRRKSDEAQSSKDTINGTFSPARRSPWCGPFGIYGRYMCTSESPCKWVRKGSWQRNLELRFGQAAKWRRPEAHEMNEREWNYDDHGQNSFQYNTILTPTRPRPPPFLPSVRPGHTLRPRGVGLRERERMRIMCWIQAFLPQTCLLDLVLLFCIIGTCTDCVV